MPSLLPPSAACYMPRTDYFAASSAAESKKGGSVLVRLGRAHHPSCQV